MDYDYIANQGRKLKELAEEYDRNQIKRIQSAESKTPPEHSLLRFTGEQRKDIKRDAEPVGYFQGIL